MDDNANDDWLAEAFTRFRTEVRHENRPPGTPAVRHAVRRRRGIRVAAAVVAVVLVGAVVGIVATGYRAAPHPAVATVHPPTTAPSALAFQAYQALRNEPTFSEAFFKPVTADMHNQTYSLDHAGSSPMQFAQGEPYDLLAQCTGRGTVVVAWQAPGGVSGHATVVCGAPVLRVHFVPQTDVILIHIKLTPDADAIDRAGIAVGYDE